jgi:hypothetical protein
MKRILGVVAMLALFLPLVSLAADFRSGDNPSFGKNESARNLYTAGRTVSVDGNVSGDVNAAGGTVNINGNVENTLQVAGGNVFVKGNAGQNERIPVELSLSTVLLVKICLYLADKSQSIPDQP